MWSRSYDVRADGQMQSKGDGYKYVLLLLLLVHGTRSLRTAFYLFVHQRQIQTWQGFLLHMC